MIAKTEPNTENRVPDWDLSDLYASTDAPEIDQDLSWAESEATAFQDAFSGRVADLPGEELGAAIVRYEQILERAYKVASYAQLLQAADTANADIAQFHQTCRERVNGITGDVLFFSLEITRMADDVLAERLAAPAAHRYSPWIDAERLMRPYQLDDAREQLLHDKSVTGRSAWARLFDETMADLRCAVDGQQLTLGETLNRMSDVDSSKREMAAAGLSSALSERSRVFSLITNIIAKDKQIEDTARGLPRPMSGRNIANQVEDDVVDALASAVREYFPRLGHRYYQLKASWFGVDALAWWDRNAPLPATDERTYTWPEARDTVLTAYAGFAPDMARTAQSFFDHGWIDAAPRSGKNSGAFSHPVVPSAHPYILMNFFGKPRDVMTLAHELGHGVHQILAGPQGALLSNTPLTLAETASVFGEMLTFRALLDAETDPQKRRIMLAGKVEDMLNTVVRQIAFHNFEVRVHDARADGELTAEQLADIWMETQAESLGPGIALDEAYRPLWSYIPHFVHTPFYVYAYAFGDCLVNALYGLYEDGHPEFQNKYLEMLKAGGTLRHRELLAPFGLDASDPAFWRRGLDVIAGFVDELETAA